jgi:hypothetical protein
MPAFSEEDRAAQAAKAQRAAEGTYQRVLAAVRAAGGASMNLMRQQGCSHNGAMAFIERMQQEGVIGEADESGQHPLIAP